ncbi:multiple sugar transport system substrate-binding protein [Paenibacillus sp. UNCCL117]|uniref:ABC transporter substrate-binding protein n=1 Tax=unclassified Paenibacillus TaxID=185978 RepID=UPI0008868640|nr:MULTISPECIES: extracellular solute-binding protein [unclassified Paenibacillus]SDC55571.1 carbohydrate ABC transporter substrate-binding protein, CUT1 family [Paenibacillus sp. cl123]SFW10918.1 multiple sugar transport system substrate-binding protein [Paenibacillus sp. UNCCL117]
MKKWQYTIASGILITFVTACSSGGGEESKSPVHSVNQEGKTIVTMSVQQPIPFYQTAEKKFEEKNPDIDLQIKVTEDYEQYQKTTSTEILSGKGPDIFEISGLPIKDYVNKNLLLNMGELMEQDKTLNKSDLQMNILDALKSDDGILYAMPFGFNLRAFVGDGNILKNAKIDDQNWSWKQFEEISKQLGESGAERRYAMAGEAPDFRMQEMIVDRYTEFVDPAAKKAMFDSPVFVGAMQQIKDMYDHKVMTSEPADIGKQMFYSTVLRSPADFIDGLHAFFSNPKLLQKPEQKGGTRIVPASQFSIQAKSPVKEEAWKFIVFMLSEEGQSLQERPGFSLLKSVNEKQLNDIQQQVKSGTYKTPDGKLPKMSDNEIAKFKEFINTADSYAEADGKVISIVGEESMAFFSGQKTADNVAKLIQNRVTTYLNE